mmetsp:Transcript_18209/g.31557  ORF Transcript_18209/g.31557 Transcript_18209/m.31557 type:complete len:88 (-) Transcript_18209:73-336(-)
MYQYCALDQSIALKVYLLQLTIIFSHTVVFPEAEPPVTPMRKGLPSKSSVLADGDCRVEPGLELARNSDPFIFNTGIRIRVEFQICP